MGLCGHKVTPGTSPSLNFHCLALNSTCLPIYLTIPIFFFSSQVLGCLFYAYYVFVRLCIPQFRSISLQFFDLRAMVLGVFNSILPGKINNSIFRVSFSVIQLAAIVFPTFNAYFFSFVFTGVLILFLGFFAFLHCWLNAFAEMLHFGDRMFYKVPHFPLTLLK